MTGIYHEPGVKPQRANLQLGLDHQCQLVLVPGKCHRDLPAATMGPDYGNTYAIMHAKPIRMELIVLQNQAQQTQRQLSKPHVHEPPL